MLNADLEKLNQKIGQLESLVEEKDAQIAAILGTLADKEKEIEELHQISLQQDASVYETNQNQHQDPTPTPDTTLLDQITAKYEAQIFDLTNQLELAKTSVKPA